MPLDASVSPEANPVLVEVTRGGVVESRHRGAFAVVDTHGHVVLSAGQVDAPVFPRSTIKPIQALALLESGAANAYGLSEAELALACASHNGERDHVDTVTAWLARLGLGAGDLECGGHAPKHTASAQTLSRAGQGWDARHDNCSGKHAGFLTLAKHLGAPTRGYIDFTHPVQQRVLGVLEQMTGLDDLTGQPRGIDGCGIPTIALPLGNLALALARFGDPDDQPDRRQAACRRLLQAVAAQPRMIAGTDRVDSATAAALGRRCLAKTGAEGVCGRRVRCSAAGTGPRPGAQDRRRRRPRGRGRAATPAPATAAARRAGGGSAGRLRPAGHHRPRWPPGRPDPTGRRISRD